MTFGMNADNGTGTINLTQQEWQVFDNDHSVITTRATRTGIVEVTVKKRVVCPSAETRRHLRGVLGNPKCSGMTVAQLIPHLSATSPITLDLQKFANLVGGDVPIADIANG